MMPELKPAEEITALEVLCYWERLREKTWGVGFSVFRSPNRQLRAIVHDEKCLIAVMWDAGTSYVYQSHAEVGVELMRALGYTPSENVKEAQT